MTAVLRDVSIWLFIGWGNWAVY